MNIIKSTLLFISFIFSGQVVAMELEETYTLEEAKKELAKNPYALHDACNNFKGNSYLKAAMLIEAGADVNAIDENNLTPLHYVAYYNNPATLTLLIKNDANVNATDNIFNRTPLFIASDQSIPENIEMLVNAGANINEKDSMLVYTPLMHATSSLSGQKNAMKLVELGADINKKDKTNKTALHLAANRKHSELTLLLLEKAANPFQQDINGWTALHFAAQYTYVEKSPSICAIILGNLGFYYRPNPNFTLQKLIISKLLSDSNNYMSILESNQDIFDSTQNMIITSITENKIQFSDKEPDSEFINSIRSQFIQTNKEFISNQNKQKLFRLIQKLLSVCNNERETAIKIAITSKNRDKKAMLLLTEAKNAQSYDGLPKEIKTIADQNIERLIQYQN